MMIYTENPARCRRARAIVRTFAGAVLFMAPMKSVFAGTLISGWDLSSTQGTELLDPATATAPAVSGEILLRHDGLKGASAPNSMTAMNWVGTLDQKFLVLGFDLGGNPWSVDNFFLTTQSSLDGPGHLEVDIAIDSGPFMKLTTFDQAPGVSTSRIIAINQIVTSELLVQIRVDPTNTTAANGDPSIAATGTFGVSDYYDGTSYTPIRFEGGEIGVPSVAAPTIAVQCGCVAGGAGLILLASWYRRRGSFMVKI